ncbi:uncharacterized protein PHALS_06132 [Plasmopara halstedii]|uniref:Uncharacterized protein n=1 Tax=Plasmopara halstedii TaxID=4781 RepID=A0A0P1B2R0_PLAHL|nr:uncharacterized protein PHALS_06132 [Plasmopara halstedii]CEG48303.1 hypothetical protein PHALS_06132 [Plasmopara halstedii]|eukprot:XP_024584672.1 hypothetical protein PHALS_06132 [Plasmopara halstedii]
MWRQEIEETQDKTPQGRAHDAQDFLLHHLHESTNNSQANSVQWHEETDREPLRSAIRSKHLTADAASAAPWSNTTMSRSEIDRNWSARIRASIARLIEIDGVSLDSESYAKLTEGHVTRESDQAFQARVDRLQAASREAHKEYLGRLHNVRSTSTTKKMRLTAKSSAPSSAAESLSFARPPASSRTRYPALDTLAVAATEKMEEHERPSNPPTLELNKDKRSNRQQNALPLTSSSGCMKIPVQVHDPQLVRAIDKLTDKLAQLLHQLQATSDADAAEPILAAAAAIALEATEIRRCEEVALARMVEIEEHRQQIMQGLLEYAKRKEQRGSVNSHKSGLKPSSSANTHDSQRNSGTKADDK